MAGEDGAYAFAWKPRMRTFLRGFADLVLPPRAFDGGGLTHTAGYSADAWSRITFLEAPVCDGCGAAMEHAGFGDRCTACLAKPRLYSRARAACVYDEASRDLILALKHADRTELSGQFAAWLSRAAADLAETADLVAPVPLHRWRLLRRRYNQAAEVARPFARTSGKTYAPEILQRVRPGGQGGKSAAGRRRTVSQAFVVPPRQRDRIAGRRILLVDDVMTTGATAEACARALLRAGARAVDVAVIARTPHGRS